MLVKSKLVTKPESIFTSLIQAELGISPFLKVIEYYQK